jgi:hypothetical protein
MLKDNIDVPHLNKALQVMSFSVCAIHLHLHLFNFGTKENLNFKLS